MGDYNAYQIAIGSGLIILAGWIVAYLLCWIGQWAWAWVDDSKAGDNNVLISKILTKVFGLEYKKDRFNDMEWHSKSGSRVFEYGLYVCMFWVLTSLIPLAIVLCIKFYYVALSLFSLCCLMFLSRFARRHKKLFDKHVKDKEAHK